MRNSVFAAMRRFWADASALVTIQVVLFSVMLFGSIGFIIDFGRAYSAHSQMQSYIDQVALAAAAELDARVDGTDVNGDPVVNAITRATDAANNVSKVSVFTEGGGQFQIAQLVFLTDAPTDANGEFDYSLVTGGTLTTTDPTQARFVLAVAQQASVRASLLDINIGSMGTAIQSIPIGTYAVATSRQVTCEGLSTLVMCNPFEDDTTQSLESVLQAGDGFRMKLTASTTLGLTSTADEIGLGLIRNPWSTIGTDSGPCEDVTSIPGYSVSMSATQLENLRDTCLLAVVDTGLSCVNDSLIVKEALPETVTTGIDVIFDMWDGPMAQVISNPTPEWGANFYPDIAAVHGNLRREEVDPYFQTLIAATTNRRLRTSYQNEYAVIAGAYVGDSTNPASRQNHIPVRPTQNGPMESPPCFDSTCSGPYAKHGAIYDFDNQPVDYAAGYYTPYVRSLMPVGSSGVDGSYLVGSNNTFYKFYSFVERLDANLHEYAASNGVDYNPPTDSPDVGVISNYFVRTWPDNFSAVYPGQDMTAVERRRVRMAVVNCGGKTVTETVNGVASYRVDVEDVVDVFLTRAPVVKTCASTVYDSTNDPQGMRPCDNSDISEMELHVEYIGSVRDDLPTSRSRTYAVLVH